MFKTVNAYDEVVAKATDEKQTVENWDILLTVWDKVNEDGEAGARNCVAALLKRLQHRSATVQLFSLTLAGALVNNCGSPFQKEINGKAFTSTLVRLVNDNTTHAEVKKRILKLIDEWVKEFGKDPDFDPMTDVHAELAKTHKFGDERPSTPVRGGPTAEDLRREEEELQRVLAMSAADADPLRGFQKSQPSTSNPYDAYRKALPQQPVSPLETSFVPPASSSAIREPEREPGKLPQRVKALYDFATQTGEELDFKQGEIVNILERVDASWWRGELRGRTGIFPTNYVEELPDLPPAAATPTVAAARASNQSPVGGNEVDMEASVFSQAASIDNLLQMMRTVDVSNENVAENEELLELYQQSMAIRPKVVKLIEKYNQKKANLREINEKFARAKQTYDAMVEESSQRYTQQQYYQSQQQPGYHQPGYGAQPDQAAIEQQQREEYERQLAAYHVAMEQYNQQQALAAQQYYAQQQSQQQPSAGAVGYSGQPQSGQPYSPGNEHGAIPATAKAPEAQQPPNQPQQYYPGQDPPSQQSAAQPQQYHTGQDPASLAYSQNQPQSQTDPHYQAATPAASFSQAPEAANAAASAQSAPVTANTQPGPTPGRVLDPSGQYEWDGVQWVWLGQPAVAADPNGSNGAATQAAAADSQAQSQAHSQAQAAQSAYGEQAHAAQSPSGQASYQLSDPMVAPPQQYQPPQPSHQLSDQMEAMSINGVAPPHPATSPQPSAYPANVRHQSPPIVQQQIMRPGSTTQVDPARAQSPPAAASLPPTQQHYVDPYSAPYAPPQGAYAQSHYQPMAGYGQPYPVQQQ